MKTISTVKPPFSMFLIEQTKNGKCNLLFFENVKKTEENNENIRYEYDLYILKDVIFHDNLEKNILKNINAWMKMAKSTNII